MARAARKRKLTSESEGEPNGTGSAAPRSETMDAAAMTCAAKKRKGRTGRPMSVRRQEPVGNSISSLPVEVLQAIFTFVDPPTLIKNCSRVCSQWHTVIKQTPWEKLPKYVYKEITVACQNGFEIKLERNVHSDNRPPLGEEGSKKPRKLEKSIRRERPDLDEGYIHHYAQSPWKDRLAEIILDTRAFWILDLDGISPEMSTVENRLKRWLRPVEAIQETGSSPLDVVKFSEVDIKRKNILLKFENCRSTRLLKFWKKALEILPYVTESLPAGNSWFGPAVPHPEPGPPPQGRVYWKKPPKICKILETCFDGQRRYSAHRGKVVIEDEDSIRFSVCLQR